MPRPTATTAKPLPLAERKRRVAAIAKDAPPKVRAVLERINFREPTAKERDYADHIARGSRKAA